MSNFVTEKQTSFMYKLLKVLSLSSKFKPNKSKLFSKKLLTDSLPTTKEYMWRWKWAGIYTVHFEGQPVICLTYEVNCMN